MSKKLSKKLMKLAKGGSTYGPVVFVVDGRPVNAASVQVLEGTAAAAIYGSRASNGVIIITSADATTGAGMSIKLRSADAAKK